VCLGCVLNILVWLAEVVDKIGTYVALLFCGKDSKTLSKTLLVAHLDRLLSCIGFDK
jgi:hypothetical protein